VTTRSLWLRKHGAELTPRAAVALGETEWLRARHADGKLGNPPTMKADCAYGGLLGIAALNDRLDMVELLLELGFDPDERAPIEGADRDGWGGPLDECAHWGRFAIAETLLWHPLCRSLECFKLVLQHGNPDASLYFGRTILHDIVGTYGRDRTSEGRDRTGDAVGFASAVLDAGGPSTSATICSRALR
jgi:hypothetical protein